jgi:glycosyltransferase involved in cell wall biosynthesis
MKLSIIVTTYNRPDALNLVLAGLKTQHGLAVHDWEVLIADDGSQAPTKELVTHWQKGFPCVLKHLWHPDQGFRAGAVRNLAALNAQGEYLIFLDGDCVPMPDFALQHLQLAESGWFVAGNRILCSEIFTQELLSQDQAITMMQWSKWQWLNAKLGGKINRALPWLRLKLTTARKKRPTRWEVMKSCNLGVWRNDYVAINGFDETFSGWGHEDSDFAVRMIRHGMMMKDGRYAVPVFHLWHKENDRSRQAENWARFEKTLHGQHTQAVIGLNQYK